MVTIMTKDVLVTIQGLQFAAEEEPDNLETVTRAEYYKKNNMHYVLYEEIPEGLPDVSKSILKFDGNMMCLTKKGVVNAHLVFEENKKNITDYQTPYGDIFIGIDTKRIRMQEEDNRITIEIDYDLEVNYEHLADCNIKVDICSRSGEEDAV